MSVTKARKRLFSLFCIVRYCIVRFQLSLEGWQRLRGDNVVG